MMLRAGKPSTIDSNKGNGLQQGAKLMSENQNGTGQSARVGIEYLDGLYSYAMVLTRNRAEAGSKKGKMLNN